MLAPRRIALLVSGALLFLFLIQVTVTRHSSYDSKASDDDTPSSAHSRIKRPLPSATALGSSSIHNQHLSSHNRQKPLAQYQLLPLRQRLAQEFPYEQHDAFPLYIWQTWKYVPTSLWFPRFFRMLERSWTALHPDYVHEIINDKTASYMIRHLYSSFPDVLEAYAALPRPVLKADFFRYLILLARGGVYTDIDTAAMRSVENWVPKDVPRSSFGLVVGIEADPDREDWADWYSRRIQFCQWTIQAKPGHPVLREIVADITEKTLRRKREGTLDHDDVHSVVDFTGPGIWTDILFRYFNDPQYFDTESSSEEISWKEFTGIKSAQKVGDVIVLPITCFSPGIKTMGAGEDDDPMAMVKHLFEGLWKPENERHIGERRH